MSRWAWRIMLLLMLLVFGLVFLQLYKQLVMLQKQQKQASVLELQSLGALQLSCARCPTFSSPTMTASTARG